MTYSIEIQNQTYRVNVISESDILGFPRPIAISLDLPCSIHLMSDGSIHCKAYASGMQDQANEIATILNKTDLSDILNDKEMFLTENHKVELDALNLSAANSICQ